MQNARLNINQQRFFKLLTGTTSIGGNASKCYQAVYNVKDEHMAQVSASRLMNKPKIKKLLDEAEQRAIDNLTLNAEYVLRESKRLYLRAMGDEAIQIVTTEIDEETGEENHIVTEEQGYDPKTAKAALQLIGQHRNVQAFTQTVEHTHTHRLEQRLAARSKAIEGRAVRGVTDESESVSAINDAGLASNTGDKADIDAFNGVGVPIKVEKRVHQAEIQKNGKAGEKSLFEVDGQRSDIYTPISTSLPPKSLIPPTSQDVESLNTVSENIAAVPKKKRKYVKRKDRGRVYSGKPPGV